MSHETLNPQSDQAEAERPAVTYRRYRGMPYRVECLPSHQRQAEKLEALRIKWRYHEWDFRCIARVGVVARQYVPWLVGLYLGYRLSFKFL